MKPPRIYKRGNYYYIRFHEPGRRNAVDRATGIRADHIDWKKSKHVKILRLKVAEIEDERHQKKHGVYYTELAKKRLVSWAELLEEFNKANEIDRDKPLAPKTLIHRRNAVSFLQKWRDIPPHKFNRDTALEFRAWAKTKLEPKSLKGYFGVYQTLMKFAVRYGAANEIAGIRISAPKKEVRMMDEQDLKTLLTFLYHKNRPFMDQIFFLALSGWRKSDGCKLLRSQIKPSGIKYLNTKVGRNEIQPVTKAMEFTLSGDFGGFVFLLRSERNVGYYLARACEHAKVPRITPHDLKRYHIQSVARRAKTDPRTFELVAHHSPTTAQTAMDHYAGRDLVLIQEALDNTHEPWLPFIQNLPSTFWDNEVYSLTNDRGKQGRNKKGHSKVA